MSQCNSRPETVNWLYYSEAKAPVPLVWRQADKPVQVRAWNIEKREDQISGFAFLLTGDMTNPVIEQHASTPCTLSSAKLIAMEMSRRREQAGTTAARVASIVGHRSEPAFVLLVQLADRQFADPELNGALVQFLRDNPALIERWETWSADQRWTPSVYVEGTEVGWYDGERAYVRTHPDRAAAVADFIERLAAWLARRVVLEADRKVQPLTGHGSVNREPDTPPDPRSSRSN